jgi:hypothetical protein
MNDKQQARAVLVLVMIRTKRINYKKNSDEKTQILPFAF